jgi:hypothetical protein
MDVTEEMVASEFEIMDDDTKVALDVDDSDDPQADDTDDSDENNEQSEVKEEA